MNDKSYLFEEVLVVDDDELDQSSIQRVFKKTNFARKTISFRTAETALSFLTHPKSPMADLLLIDVNIPRMSGLDLIERASPNLLDRQVGVALLLSCPLPRELHRRAAQSPVISAYLNKPVQAPALLSLAQSMRQRQRARAVGQA